MKESFQKPLATTGANLGRFEKVAISKSEDLPANMSQTGSLTKPHRYEGFVCGSDFLH